MLHVPDCPPVEHSVSPRPRAAAPEEQRVSAVPAWEQRSSARLSTPHDGPIQRLRLHWAWLPLGYRLTNRLHTGHFRGVHRTRCSVSCPITTAAACRLARPRRRGG